MDVVTILICLFSRFCGPILNALTVLMVVRRCRVVLGVARVAQRRCRDDCGITTFLSHLSKRWRIRWLVGRLSLQRRASTRSRQCNVRLHDARVHARIHLGRRTGGDDTSTDTTTTNETTTTTNNDDGQRRQHTRVENSNIDVMTSRLQSQRVK